MNSNLSAIVAFLIGAFFTYTELRFSKYPNTGFLIASKRAVIIYCGIYGVVAMSAFLLSGLLIAKGMLKIDGLSLESPYMLAVILGLSAKAILQLNIYTVTVGSTPFPIGFQTIVQLFEPYLVRSILLEKFNAVKDFIKPYTQKFQDLQSVKVTIKQNIPDSISKQERAAFENEIDKDQFVHEAMERFLRFLGKRTFIRVFA